MHHFERKIYPKELQARLRSFCRMCGLHTLNLHMVLTQVLTGHGGFADYLHRFKCKDDPGCVCDDNVSETIIHLLMDCPQHGAAREDLQQELQMKLCRESVPIILSEASGRDRLIKYAIRIAKIAIERNRTIDIRGRVNKSVTFGIKHRFFDK